VSASPITLVGNLTADPKLDFLANGTAKLSFSIACNHYWTDQSGEKQEKTSFFNVVAWRTLAEDAAAVLSKGVKTIVVGRLEQRSYEDKEGNKKSIVEVVADNVGLSVYGVDSFERKERTAKTGNAAPQKARPKVAMTSTRNVIAEESEPF